MNWIPFAAMFPVDTSRLLRLLLPDLLVDSDLVRNELYPSASSVPLRGSVYGRAKQSVRPVVRVQTAAVGMGLYHLRVHTGASGHEWSPWLEPDSLKLWLIVEHPTMFRMAS